METTSYSRSVTVDEAALLCPHLASPAMLARADTNGKWQMARHLSAMNRELMDIAFGVNERLIINLPFQVGKSWLCSHYFPAWVLLLFPETRIILATHSDHYAATFGSKVREVIKRFGGPHGINLREDTKAKNEWVIDEYGGGLVCKGIGSALVGRPADLLIIDDPIKDAEQAMSPVQLESQWDWFVTAAYSRLGPKAPIAVIMTRWAKGDLCGRILAESKETGEQWKVIKFRAIAGDNDILGRKPGEALWPERQPLARLERIRQTRGRWFESCWQQNPLDEQGLLFRPRPVPPDYDGWPRYINTGDAFRVQAGLRFGHFRHAECTMMVGIDWAMGKKKESDFTAFTVGALTQDGKLFIVDCKNERIRLDENAKRLADLCRQYRPHIVAGDDDMLAESMVLECRRHREIPEIKRLPISGKAKSIRASAAIIRGDNGLIYLPDRAPWLEMCMDALSGFTGQDDEHDDVADTFGILGRLADELKGDGRAEPEPCLLIPPRDLYGY